MIRSSAGMRGQGKTADLRENPPEQRHHPALIQSVMILERPRQLRQILPAGGFYPQVHYCTPLLLQSDWKVLTSFMLPEADSRRRLTTARHTHLHNFLVRSPMAKDLASNAAKRTQNCGAPPPIPPAPTARNASQSSPNLFTWDFVTYAQYNSTVTDHIYKESVTEKHCMPVQRLARKSDEALGVRVILTRTTIPRRQKKILGLMPMVLKLGVHGATSECKSGRKREIPEKTASFGIQLSRENIRECLRRENNSLTTAPPRSVVDWVCEARETNIDTEVPVELSSWRYGIRDNHAAEKLYNTWQRCKRGPCTHAERNSPRDEHDACHFQSQHSAYGSDTYTLVRLNTTRVGSTCCKKNYRVGSLFITDTQVLVYPFLVILNIPLSCRRRYHITALSFAFTRSYGTFQQRYTQCTKTVSNMSFEADLPWRSQLVRHRCGVREALSSNPGQGMGSACAVRPSSSSVAAIPEDAAAKGMQRVLLTLPRAIGCQADKQLANSWHAPGNISGPEVAPLTSNSLLITGPGVVNSNGPKPMRVKRGVYGAAPECKGGRNGHSPRKYACQRHRPARLPRTKIRVTPPGIEPYSPRRTCNAKLYPPILLSSDFLDCPNNGRKFKYLFTSKCGAAVVTNTLGLHSRGRECYLLSGHLDFGFPLLYEIVPGERWDGSWSQAIAELRPRPRITEHIAPSLMISLDEILTRSSFPQPSLSLIWRKEATVLQKEYQNEFYYKGGGDEVGKGTGREGAPSPSLAKLVTAGIASPSCRVAGQGELGEGVARPLEGAHLAFRALCPPPCFPAPQASPYTRPFPFAEQENLHWDGTSLTAACLSLFARAGPWIPLGVRNPVDCERGADCASQYLFWPWSWSTEMLAYRSSVHRLCTSILVHRDSLALLLSDSCGGLERGFPVMSYIVVSSTADANNMKYKEILIGLNLRQNVVPTAVKYRTKNPVCCKLSSAGMEGRGKQKIPEKTRRPAPSSGMILTCDNPGATSPGIEPGSPSVARWTVRGIVLWKAVPIWSAMAVLANASRLCSEEIVPVLVHPQPSANAFVRLRSVITFVIQKSFVRLRSVITFVIQKSFVRLRSVITFVIQKSFVRLRSVITFVNQKSFVYCLYFASGEWATYIHYCKNTGSVSVCVKTHRRPIEPYHTGHYPVL
ncbi:hypothetical protein PR048_015488 [Dryococelus australis]|uniref:Uncharacterized protein n=1 Tax=Dryococelus australis TaxID=614101 RepID=A0ABQ9HH27_9NEOP|nr:hypothetical protein PR048_015488 [Dryococelus australis]